MCVRMCVCMYVCTYVCVFVCYFILWKFSYFKRKCGLVLCAVSTLNYRFQFPVLTPAAAQQYKDSSSQIHCTPPTCCGLNWPSAWMCLTMETSCAVAAIHIANWFSAWNMHNFTRRFWWLLSAVTSRGVRAYWYRRRPCCFPDQGGRWWWGQQVSPKRQYTFTGVQGVISEQTVKTWRTPNLTTIGSHKNKNPIHIQNVYLIFIPSIYKHELRNGRRVGRVLRRLCTLCAHEDIHPARQYHRQGLQQVSAEYKSIMSPQQDTFEGSLEAM